MVGGPTGAGAGPELLTGRGRGSQDDLVEPPGLSDGVVRLRALREGDVGTGAPGQRSVVAQCLDPESVRWTSVPLGYTPALGADFVATAALAWATGTTLAVADATDDSFLGSVDLRPGPPGTFEVGFGLGSWARGRGVMTRALSLLLGWAFRPAPAGLGADLVRWSAHVGNWGSRRVAWKAGFRGFGEVRGLLDHRGVATDAWVATVRADELGHPDGRWLVVPTLPFTARDGSAWVLRPWRDDEAEVAAVTRACSDPVTQRWLAHLPRGYSPDDARAFLRRAPEGAATGRSVAWAVAPVLPTTDDQAAGSGSATGSLSLFDLDAPYGTPELGWWADPSVRGRGVVAAAVRAGADWALHAAPDGVRTHRLNVQVDAGNHASMRVALAAGFTEFGRGHAEDQDPAGGFSDCRYFELLRADVAGADVGAGVDARQAAPETAQQHVPDEESGN